MVCQFSRSVVLVTMMAEKMTSGSSSRGNALESIYSQLWRCMKKDQCIVMNTVSEIFC